MKLIPGWAIVALLTVTILGCHEAKRNVDSAPRPSRGSVAGVVKLEGTAPPRRRINIEADRDLVKLRAGEPLFDNRLLVSKDGGLADAIVFVTATEGLPAEASVPPAAPAVIRFQRGELLPRVTGVVVGQTLRIEPEERAVVHNAHLISLINAEFNVAVKDADRDAAQPPNPNLDRVFRKPELSVPIRCDIHSWELAVVHVMANRYFVVTRADGSFEIKDLPPGEYELAVFHDHKRLTPDQPSMRVRIVDGQTATAGFVYRIR